MHITLDSSTTLCITNMGPHYDALAALPGATYDRSTKSLNVSLCYLRHLLTRYSATVDDLPGCIAARLDMWRRWIQQHNHCGVWFALAVDGETVVPVGEGVSPLFVEWVGERSAILVQFLGDQVAPTSQLPVTMLAPTSLGCEGDRLIWNGIVNAAKAAVVERAKGKKKLDRIMQGVLLP